MDESRAFQTCEHVALGPDVLVTEGRWDRVDALILAVDDNRLRVRATQSFSGEPGSLDIVEGEEFEISRSQVFAVSITTDPAQKP